MMKSATIYYDGEGLHPNTPNKEVERLLKVHGIKLKASVGGDPYAVDYHYERFVLASIVTLEDAERFLKQLDRECNDHQGTHVSGCKKAAMARSWLAEPFWQATPERIRAALACNRRVCCAAHESYSFALHARYVGKR